MGGYRRELVVDWGDCDPFGIAYYPRIVAWFNETEHHLFRHIGHPAEALIGAERALVMGEISFRFLAPVAPGERVMTEIALTRIGERTLHWACRVQRSATETWIAEGRSTRVYVHRDDDGRLASAPVPDALREALAPWFEDN